MFQPRVRVAVAVTHNATTASHKAFPDHEIVPDNSVFMLILRGVSATSHGASWLAESLSCGSAPLGNHDIALIRFARISFRMEKPHTCN
jgi:hypothetical protein